MAHAGPGEVLIGTGRLNSVRDLISTAFESVNLDWTQYVDGDPNLLTVDEHFQLAANPAKVKKNLS